MTYEETPVTPPKAKSVKATAKKQAIKGVDNIHGGVLTWIVFKRFVRFMWANKVPVTVNLFLLENSYLFVHHFHIFAK